MILRTIFIILILQILIACSVGTISVKSYSDIDLLKQNFYAWYGLPTIQSGAVKSNDFGAANIVERNLNKILAERNLVETDTGDAKILLELRIQLQESLEIENQYRRKAGAGIFGEGKGATGSPSGKTLLPDIESPLYSGQQRGSITIIVYDADTKKPLKEGIATIVFPHDLNNQKELLHLSDVLRRLVNKLFS